jgi:hypothetical protein
MVRPRVILSLALAVSGCGHSTPFQSGDAQSSQPFSGGSPRRVTYNLGEDRAPAWLPDESGFVYSFERTDRPDHDRCLAVLPPDGGRIVRIICDRTPAADDSTNVLSDPAVDATGRLAYIVEGSLTGAVGPSYTALVLGTLVDPVSVRVLRIFPDLSLDPALHEGASQIRWLGPSSLVYLAERVGYPRPCRYCALDTVRTGADIERFELTGPPPAVAVVPGTGDASGVAVGESADVIYYTLGGDARVYRRALSTGAVTVVHSFSGIARDVQVVGSRLIAVVGGNVSFAYDSLLGYTVQTDRGGPLFLVDLVTGSETLLPGGTLAFRHPALSPSGKRVVAEAGSVADLWVFDLP